MGYERNIQTAVTLREGTEQEFTVCATGELWKDEQGQFVEAIEYLDEDECLLPPAVRATLTKEEIDHIDEALEDACRI